MNDDADGKEEFVKIADLGFSKNFEESTLGTSCGSPNYVGRYQASSSSCYSTTEVSRIAELVI